MNINLVYEGKNYNFDIPNSVTIDYLKELSSKIFNSDKALLDLLYKNEKIQNRDDNTLIRDLIPEGETNTILTVQINKDNKDKDNKDINKNEIIPLVSLKNKNIENNEKENDNNNKENSIQKDRINIINSDKKITDKKLIHIIKNNNKINNNKINNSRNKNAINKLFSQNNNSNNNNNGIKKEFDIKIFQNNFIKKNAELLELMKEFSYKIKEVYLSLFRKYKNSGGNTTNINPSPSNNTSSLSSISLGMNNNSFYELSIYEKKILNFQEKQIKYYKTLLELISKYDKNKDFFQLNDFYTNLLVNTNTIKNITITNKEDNSEQSKILKFKKSSNKKLFSNNNSLLNNLSSLNINNDNYLPILKNKNFNSSLHLEKKNINFNLSNNISNLNLLKTNSKGKTLNVKLDKGKEIFQKNNNININPINTTKAKRNSSLETKLTTNNILKNSNLNQNNNELNKNNNNKESDKDKKNDNISVNSDNLSEKDLVDTLTINENKKSKIAPIPLHIRNSISTNILPRKFSVINNSFRSNNILNNNGGLESKDKVIEEKKRPKLLRFSSINEIQNRLKNSPTLNKKITINETTLNKSKRKILNESENSVGYINMKKIKYIDLSSMTVNDSNFIRDKQKYNNKKKNNKDMNKYDFFM